MLVNPPAWGVKSAKSSWAAMVKFFGKKNLPVGPAEQELGGGRYGFVWATQTPEKVFKVTTDPTEALFVAWYLRLKREIIGLTKYYKLARLPGEVRSRPIYGILRSAALSPTLADASQELPSEIRQDAIGDLYNAKHWAALTRDYLKRSPAKAAEVVALSQDTPFPTTLAEHVGGMRRRGVARAAHCLMMFRSVATDFANDEVLYNVGNALLECLDEGVLLADVHANNVMRDARTGEWTITDPGHAVFLKPGAAAEVPVLS